MGNKTLPEAEFGYITRIQIRLDLEAQSGGDGLGARPGNSPQAPIPQGQEALHCGCFVLTWLSTAYK
jgi:hypothetical protein